MMASPLVAFSGGEGRGAELQAWVLKALLAVTIIIQAVTIALYKRRKVQMRLCCVAMVLLAVYFVVFIVGELTKTGTVHLPIFLRVAALPLVSLVFTWMSLHAIHADEELVRSADRIR